MNPEILFLGIFPKKPKNSKLKRYMPHYVDCSIIYTAKIWKQPKCLFIDEERKMMWYINTKGYYSDVKNEYLPFATTWMKLEDSMLNEVSQKEKTNTIRFHLHVGSKKQMNKAQTVIEKFFLWLSG